MMYWKLTILPLIASMLAISQPTCHAGGPASELMKAGGRVLLRQGVKQGAQQAAKQAAKQSTKTLAQQAALATARRTTATAARHFGDDLVRAGSRFSDDLAKASAKMTGRQQRRLAIMAKEMNQTGKTGLVGKLAASSKPGSLVDDMWQHRGKIAAGVGAATVLIHGDDIAKAGGEYVTKPLIEGTMQHVIAPTAKPVILTLLVLVLVGLLVRAIAFAPAWNNYCLVIGSVK